MEPGDKNSYAFKPPAQSGKIIVDSLRQVNVEGLPLHSHHSHHQHYNHPNPHFAFLGVKQVSYNSVELPLF